MKKKDALLISLPWADYKAPSLQIGTLSAYARGKGFDVDALHLHIEAAALFGINDYSTYSLREHRSCGDALCAALFYPSARERLLHYVERRTPGAKRYLSKLEKTLRGIFKHVDWANYGIVGFTITFDQLFASLLMARWIKEKNPDIRIVFGGRAIAGEMGRTAIELFPFVDWCIDGEGEAAFVSILRHMRTGRGGFEAEVPGLIHRSAKGIVINEQRQLSKLDGLPDPDFDHYFRTLEGHPKLRDTEILPYLPVEASRGCSYRCAFCCDCQYWRGYRPKPAPEVTATIRRLSEKYQINTICFIAQLIEKPEIDAIFPLLKKHAVDYRLFCEVRADVSKEELRAMKAAGISEVQIGIEALNSSLLKKMRKGTRLIDNLKAMKYCEELGIGHISNLMVGFPTETQTEVDDSVKAFEYALSYRPPINTVDFQIRDGSPVYMNPEQYSITHIDEASDYGHQLPASVRKQINLWYKGFRSKRKPRRYKAFKQKLERWRKFYSAEKAGGRPILGYFDCDSYLRIEDFREGTTSIVLEGWARELYLFCDEIKGFEEIEGRFEEVPEEELRKMLRNLFGLKLMYTEDDDWLSLAIHASPENRRHMPFL